MLMYKVCTAGLGVMLLIGLAGCGGEQHDVVAVTGTVKYKGQPVEGATVAFHGGTASAPATAVTDASGNFKLTSYNPGDGAPAGNYKVTVTKKKREGAVSTAPVSMEAALKQGPADSKETNSLPAKYASQDITPLNATVEKGKTNDIPLELTD